MKIKFFSTDVACNVYLQGRTHRFAPTAYCHCLLLLVLLTATFCAAAQNGVTVSNLEMDAGTVTFKVSWDKKDPTMPALWSDTVWVWVDYNNAGTMTRLPLLPGATLTDPSWDNAEVIEEFGNNNGVWVVGNARSAGTFSATVVGAGFKPAPTGGACVYASNYPPVGQYTAAGTIRFTGTPPYYLAYSAGGAATVTREQVEGDYALTYPLASFTDATGAPGVVSCLPPALQTLTASASGFCAGTAGVTFALSGTQSGATYQLLLGDSLVGTLAGTGSAATFTDPLAHEGVYTAQVAAENGYCAAAMTGSHTVSANPLPVATVSASTICSGATAACSATLGAGATSAMTYTWNIGGTSSSTTGNSKTSVALTASTTYTVQLRNEYGCVGAVSSPATITVIATPYISVHPASTSTCSTATLSVAASPVTAYRWLKNNIATSEGSGYESATYTTAALIAGASYSVVVANGPCSITSNTAVVSMKSDCPTDPGTTVNFTAFKPSSAAPTGSVWYLADTRESNNSQTYTVKKMADGRIWMVQDLKFGNKCNTKSFSGSVDIDQRGLISSATGYTDYYGACFSRGLTGAGYSYDWAAAIQRPGANLNGTQAGCSGLSSGASCQGLCPAGWHLPTGSASGDFHALYTAMSATGSCRDMTCWNSTSTWVGFAGGSCSCYGEYCIDEGNWWSSTRATQVNSYIVRMAVGVEYDATQSYRKCYPAQVRCVQD